MTHRDQQLLALRPPVPAALLTEGMSDEERFQNETLRPILKLQLIAQRLQSQLDAL